MEKNLSCGGISSHEGYGHKSVLSQFMLFCREICFVAIYAVFFAKYILLLFMRFCVEKIEPKIVSLEKKRTIIRYEL